MATHVSSISQALVGSTDALTIPKPYFVDDTVAGDGLAAVGPTSGHSTGGLPTPPNSISPNLPPHAFKAKAAKDLAASPPDHVDSDIDLQDAVDHANSQGLSVSGGAEGVNGITPDLLAKYHLADIVLDKGPIAIRHVMNHLANTVPGFAEIPPAKARRIVVAALESRHGGGVRGNVEFEKVGWGRWDARVKGHPTRENRSIYAIQEDNVSPDLGPAKALRIPGSGQPRQKARRLSHGSWTAESTLSSRSEHGDRNDVPEHEADKMSIDDDDERRPSLHDRRAHHRVPQDQFYSDTDEEDWESMGVAALRQNSFPSKSARPKYVGASQRSGSRSTSFSSFGRTRPLYQRRQNAKANLDFSGVDVDSQEREAIEALMRMGST